MLGLVVSACAQEAALIRESPSGGVVAYPFRTESDTVSSKARSDALRLIAQQCQRGSRILREGEVPRVQKNVDRAWNDQMGGNRLWGLEFACK